MRADQNGLGLAKLQMACLQSALCLATLLAPVFSIARELNAPIPEAVHRGSLICDQAQPIIPESIQRTKGFVSASVVARMEIAVPGRPRRVEIEVSSGFPDLDHAVEAALMHITCRKDEGGPATTRFASQEFQFDLAGGGAMPSGPESAPLLVGRGGYWFRRHDLDRALADYNEAIRRDPKLSLAYFHRAVLHFRRENLDDALADLNRILDNGRADAAALRLRARIKVRQHDVAGATRDFQAAATISQISGDYIDLGYALFSAGEYASSSAAFSTAFAQGVTNKYGVIWRFLASALQGSEPAALKVLEQDRSDIKDSTWPTPVIDFYLQKVSEEQLLAAAQTAPGSSLQGRLCEAKFYIGERALVGAGFSRARRWLEAAAKECAHISRIDCGHRAACAAMRRCRRMLGCRGACSRADCNLVPTSPSSDGSGPGRNDVLCAVRVGAVEHGRAPGSSTCHQRAGRERSRRRGRRTLLLEAGPEVDRLCHESSGTPL